MVAYVVVWNGVILLGMWMGGGGFTYQSVPARTMMLVALWGTAIFALMIAYSPQVQAVTLRSRENIPGLRKELWFIAILTVFISLVQVLVQEK